MTGQTCHLCDAPAVARLVFIHKDGTEGGRTAAKCQRHYNEALDLWYSFSAAVPEAVGDLTVWVN